MASYPAGIPAFSAPGATLSSPTHTSLHTSVDAEVIAICTTLGTNPQTTYASVAARLLSIEAALSGTGHTQNTDKGTTNATFYINGITGPYLKGSGVNLQIRNSADSGFVNVTAQDVNVQGNLTNGVNSVTVAEVATAVADDHTHANKATLDTYNQTNANLTSAVSLKHTQNTDTGTSGETFQMNNVNPLNSAKIKVDDLDPTKVEIRNAADSGYADIRAANFLGQLTADNLDVFRPSIRFEDTGNHWQISNNGTTWQDIAAGTTLSGTAGCVEFVNLAGTNLASDTTFVFNETTNILSLQALTLGVRAATMVPGIAKFISAGTLAANDFSTTFTAGTQTADASYTLPVGLPPGNRVLQSTSAGVLSWIDPTDVDTLQTVTARGATTSLTCLFQNAAAIELGKDETAGTPNVAGSLKLFSAGDNAFYTTITAGTQSVGNIAYVLPITQAAGANYALVNNGSGTLSWAATVAPSAHTLLSHSDAVSASPVLGDLLYGNVTPNWTKLAGNTTLVKQFLTQTGTGAISAVPVWDVIAAGDIPNLFLKLDQTTPQSIINGRPTFAQGLLLGTSPTVGAFAEGKMYYNATKKAVAAELDTDITLNLGEQDVVYCYNPGGAIAKGELVYPTGGSGNFPTIAKAQADTEPTSLIIGVAMQAIGATGYGFALVRGVIEGTAAAPLDTSAFLVGDTLYLSPTVAGGFTKTAPTFSQFLVRVGVCLVSHATLGSIYIRPVLKNRLSDLSDTDIASPTTDQILKWNGTNWYNGAGVSSSAGPGVAFYLDDTQIIPPGVGPLTVPLHTLSKTPITTVEVLDTVTVNNNTLLLEHYLYNTALGGTSIEAGTWTFNTYNYASAVVGTTTMPKSVYKVMAGAGTLAVTGSGTSRTATITAGTPFLAADANADITLCGYLQTPTALLRITGWTSTSVVTVETLSTYVNESGVAYSVHRYLFNDPGVDIQNTSVGLNISTSAQAAFTIDPTDKLAISYFGRTTRTSNTDVTLVHNGTSHYSHFLTPLVIRHNDLAELQGGGAAERYHLTLAQHTIATQAATGSLAGYLSSANWTTFNGKQDALTFGIADTNKVQINSADVADNDYAKFTATGLEGRSYAEVLSDIAAAPVASPTFTGTVIMPTQTNLVAGLKIPTGTLLDTTVAGTLENNGTHLYFTFANSGARYQLDQQAVGSMGVRGTFVNGDLAAGILTITHSLGLATPYVMSLTIVDNAQKMIIPDEVTFLTNTITVDLTSYGALSGTWGYYYI
jgi:hypothetical protein